MRTLTPLQYEASLRTIFGDEVPTARIGPRKTSLASASAGIGDSLVLDYEASALTVAAWAFHVDKERRERLAGCTPIADATDPCLRTVLGFIGRLAFRRNLRNDELKRYVVLAAKLGADDPWEGLAFAVSALLQSPHFLYREESVDESGQRYAPSTIAARLAFFLWNAPPDKALLVAADDGELDTAEGIAALVPRMLADPRAAVGRQRLLAELFHVDLLDDLEKDPIIFPDFDDEL